MSLFNREMRKAPWDEDWSVHPVHGTWVVTPSPYAEDGKLVASFNSWGDGARTEASRARLAAAAPKMVQALLELVRLSPESSEDKAVVMAREALRHAGLSPEDVRRTE